MRGYNRTRNVNIHVHIYVYRNGTNFIMKITEKALFNLKERVASKQTWGARLSITGGGCGGYMYDLNFEEMPSLTDIVYSNILAVDITSHEYLQDAVLDWKEDKLTQEFVVENLGESGRCGCGESFYL